MLTHGGFVRTLYKVITYILIIIIYLDCKLIVQLEQIFTPVYRHKGTLNKEVYYKHAICGHRPCNKINSMSLLVVFKLELLLYACYRHRL